MFRPVKWGLRFLLFLIILLAADFSRSLNPCYPRFNHLRKSGKSIGICLAFW